LRIGLGGLGSRRLFVNLGFLIIVLSVLTIGAEFVVRWAFRDVTTTTDNWSYFARRWHRTVRTNSYGFRERDFSLTKPRGIYRIAVIGDSIAYGQGIDEQDRFSNLIEKQLTHQNGKRGYEVLNFGQPGAETIDHLKILAYPVLEAEPDFVLLEWFTNDVEGHDKSERPRTSRIIPVDRIASRLQGNSALFYLLNQQWITIQHKMGWFSYGGYTDYMLKRFRDPNSVSSIAAKESLLSFIAMCKQRQIALGIVLFSSPYYGGSTLDFLTDRVLQLCREENVGCLDLRSTFFPYRSGQQLFVNPLDVHPSPFANRLATERIITAFGDVWLKSEETETRALLKSDSDREFAVHRGGSVN
jgi:hypothetical protein